MPPRKNKNTGVIFIYPGLPQLGALPPTTAWTLFHRDVDVGKKHDEVNEFCWCSPVCIPTPLVEGAEMTHKDYTTIVHTSKH